MKRGVGLYWPSANVADIWLWPDRPIPPLPPHPTVSDVWALNTEGTAA